MEEPRHALAPTPRVSHLRFGVLCLLAYVALSWAMRFDMPRGEQIASLVYPLDTFSMYAGAADQQMSHLLVRDPQSGAVHRITDYRSFDCVEPIAGSGAQCADHVGYQYHADDLTDYIRSHAGPGSAEVELISRTWQVRAGAPPAHVSDCIVAHCKVSR